MRIPLILVGRLVTTASNFDALGVYMHHAILDAYASKYPVDYVISYDGLIVGSIGGDTAFRHLPHRSVSDNSKRYGLELPTAPQCATCNSSKLAICHKIPRIYGGNLSPHNLYVDCSVCNSKQREILTPLQLLALLPYWVNIRLDKTTITDYLREITNNE